jgi:hypothetical protein
LTIIRGYLPSFGGVAADRSFDRLSRWIDGGPDAVRIDDALVHEGSPGLSICEIEFWRGRVYGEFIAVSDGMWVIGRSSRFRCRRDEGVPPPTPANFRFLEELCDLLRSRGWEPQRAPKGAGIWYARRYSRLALTAPAPVTAPAPAAEPPRPVAVADPRPEAVPPEPMKPAVEAPWYVDPLRVRAPAEEAEATSFCTRVWAYTRT